MKAFAHRDVDIFAQALQLNTVKSCHINIALYTYSFTVLNMLKQCEHLYLTPV